MAVAADADIDPAAYQSGRAISDPEEQARLRRQVSAQIAAGISIVFLEHRCQDDPATACGMQSCET